MYMRTDQEMRLDWNPAVDKAAHGHAVWRQPKDFNCSPSLWASVGTYTPLYLSVGPGYGSWPVSNSRLGGHRLSFGVRKKVWEDTPKIHSRELAVAFVGFKQPGAFQDRQVQECGNVT